LGRSSGITVSKYVTRHGENAHVVEMGGIEPPSKRLGQERATSLVGISCLALSIPTDGATARQPMFLRWPLSAVGVHRTLTLRRPFPTHQGEVEMDVAA